MENPNHRKQEAPEAVFMEHWVIYERPLDFPGGYVLRRWTIVPNDNGFRPDRLAQYFPTLKSARMAVPEGLFRIPRHPTEDDAAVLETWL